MISGGTLGASTYVTVSKQNLLGLKPHRILSRSGAGKLERDKKSEIGSASCP